MSIKKMLLVASMAFAAIAFAAPAVAQAHVTLTDASGPIGVGAGITATSTNLKTTTANGTLECAKVTLHYAVETNGPEHVVLNAIPGADGDNATAEGCVLNTGAVKLPTHITKAGTGQLTINTWGTGVTNATFTSNITGTGLNDCNFTGNVHFQATNGTDTAHVGPSPLVGTPSPPCPATGSIAGLVTLETSNGQEVTIDNVTTAGV